MKEWLFSRVKEYESTFAGLILGGAAGAGLAVQSGQITKEAVIVGAAIGALGAISKTPTWMRIFNKDKTE